MFLELILMPARVSHIQSNEEPGSLVFILSVPKLTFVFATVVQILSEGVPFELHWTRRCFLQKEGGVAVWYAFTNLADS